MRDRRGRLAQSELGSSGSGAEPLWFINGAGARWETLCPESESEPEPEFREEI